MVPAAAEGAKCDEEVLREEKQRKQPRTDDAREEVEDAQPTSSPKKMKQAAINEAPQETIERQENEKETAAPPCDEEKGDEEARATSPLPNLDTTMYVASLLVIG